MHEPVEITLKFRSPREVLVLIQSIEDVVMEADDMFEDDRDPGNGAYADDVRELRDAIWACLRDTGFELKYGGPRGMLEVKYKGRDMKYEKQPIVEPVLRSSHETTTCSS